MKPTLTIGLVGNPNCGKTTIFNALTGARQRVGNWPGVTVERKSGTFHWQDSTIEVVDLPGVYSLASVADSAIDERIACTYIRHQTADVIVNILDGANLERHLYLTLQLLEMRVPMIVVVNMMDVVHRHHIRLDLNQLQKLLGCPIVALEATKGKGIKELKNTITQFGTHPTLSLLNLPYPADISQAMMQIEQALIEQNSSNAFHPTWLAIRLLEDDKLAEEEMSEATLTLVKHYQQSIRETLNEDADILLADTRYRFIKTLLEKCVQKSSIRQSTWTAWLDRIVLNRFLGIPIFLGVMYSLFLFAINIGGAFQDFFDIGSNTLFVEGISQGLHALQAPAWLSALLANGAGKGINTTVTFIPVIGALFLFLAFLEDSGYMARAAFVVDRLMRALGLPGKSFVPMIVGFGCNVPAVMAARTLENKRDRIITVMMSPFMSCGARLAIYAVFTAAFFPTGGQNIVFALYLLGIGMAVLTGLLLRKTVLKGEPAPLLMELPPYHLPTFKTVGLHAWQRLKGFVFRAGKLIVPICIVLGALNVLNLDGTLNTGEGDVHSVLSTLGQTLTPLFAPMGIHQDNWPATVGLLTGILAKEVVIGSLNTLYSQLGHLAITAPADAVTSIWEGLHHAWASIGVNFSQLGGALANPILAKAPVHTLNQGVYGLMVERFDGQAGAIAYLLFILLYIPCISTTAAIARELSWRWASFSVFWNTILAYGAAVGFYQIATFIRHPHTSFAWIMGISGLMGVIILAVRIYAANEDKKEDKKKPRGERYGFA